jgi:hypothetical protein|tara:strand:- start:86 stop:259 length:174 start_codon:yes stop_codon:yes gene_type:complete
VYSRKIQRSSSNITPRIHIHAISQVLFDGFNVSKRRTTQKKYADLIAPSDVAINLPG